MLRTTVARLLAVAFNLADITAVASALWRHVDKGLLKDGKGHGTPVATSVIPELN